MSRIEDALKKAAHRKRSVSSKLEAEPVNSIAKVQDEPKNPVAKAAEFLLNVAPIKISNALIPTVKEEKTIAAEEYNKLRSTIIALTRSEQPLNTMLVTSTVSEEGKSMTSLNLAIALAKEQDHTVLLVDTDLRRPSLHRYFGITPECGLVHCLRDNLPLEKALIKTGIGKLVFLPAGEALRDPLDLLSSRRMKDIIHELKQRYDDRYVIFDTPPASPFSDAIVLSAMVDSTLFVVREGKAVKHTLFKTLEEFKAQNLLGVVYNDAHTFIKKQDYYYY